MIIHFLTKELVKEKILHKQQLIGKFWHCKNAYNLAEGKIGTKKKDSPTWNFSGVELHPGDKIFLKLNKFKQGRRDPDYLLYVESHPKLVKLTGTVKKGSLL